MNSNLTENSTEYPFNVYKVILEKEVANTKCDDNRCITDLDGYSILWRMCGRNHHLLGLLVKDPDNPRFQNSYALNKRLCGDLCYRNRVRDAAMIEANTINTVSLRLINRFVYKCEDYTNSRNTAVNRINDINKTLHTLSAEKDILEDTIKNKYPI
jgi:hypothetical protein